MVTYNPAVVRAVADRLYAQADGAIRSHMIVGGLGGMLIGLWAGDMLSGSGALALSYGGAVLAAIAGLVVGFKSGQQRALVLRMQAQTALCQVENRGKHRPPAR